MSTPEPLDSRRDVYTPSRLNREVRALLESGLPLLWVEGEISNLARPASGHVYFTLKDARAQVRCALFRNRGRHLRCNADDGMAVLVRARVTLYEPRGEYQLIVEHMEPAGEGALRAEFERLRLKLESEGLFREDLKRTPPRFPRRIGVITSPVGAAIRDVLTVLQRRFPAVPVRVYPVPVQGEAAAPAIVRALALASSRADCDVLVLTRGGGSLEDLWAFNEEAVVRAIHACTIPLISAVGHEVDVTLADLAADLRAPTPSAAAELAVPDATTLGGELTRHRRQFARRMRRRLQEHAQSLDFAARRLARTHPGQQLERYREQTRSLRRRLALGITWRQAQQRRTLAALAGRLEAASPTQRLGEWSRQTGMLRRRLGHALKQSLAQRARRLEALARNLTAVSPQATLNRGYAIVRRAPDARIVRAASEVARGTRVEALLSRGRLRALVEETQEDDDGKLR